MKNIDFFSKNIECTTPIPFDQAWSRASKKVGAVHSIAPYAEKYESEGAENGPFPHTSKLILLVVQMRSLAFEDQ